MADLNQTNIFIQVRVQATTKVGDFNSALYYTAKDFLNMSDEDLQSDINKAIDNYVMQVQNNPIPTKPTKDELLAQEQDLENQLTDIQAEILAVTNQTIDLPPVDNPPPVDIKSS